MSDDTPTVRFEPPGDPNRPGAPDAGDGGKAKSRTLLLVLSILGGVLLIGVVIVLTLLFARGMGGPNTDPAADVSASPSASETPSARPSATPSETPSASPSATPSAPPPPPPPPPPTTGPVFNSFAPSDNTSVGCPNNTDQIPVTFTWTSTGANEAAIGVGTNDAFAGAYETGLPPSGSYTNLAYQCSNPSQTYTVSIRGTSGQTNKTITLKR